MDAPQAKHLGKISECLLAYQRVAAQTGSMSLHNRIAHEQRSSQDGGQLCEVTHEHDTDTSEGAHVVGRLCAEALTVNDPGNLSKSTIHDFELRCPDNGYLVDQQ